MDRPGPRVESAAGVRRVGKSHLLRREAPVGVACRVEGVLPGVVVGRLAPEVLLGGDEAGVENVGKAWRGGGSEGGKQWKQRLCLLI